MLAYGMTEHKLAATIGCTKEKAKEIITSFFKIVPQVDEYLRRSGEFARINGYARTFKPINRIRWFKKHKQIAYMDDYQSNLILGDIERAGKNMPIQGCGADICKLAMVLIRQEIRDRGLWDDLKLTLQVHDEIVLEAKDESVEDLKALVRSKMLEAGKQIISSLPMEVSIVSSKEWGK